MTENEILELKLKPRGLSEKRLVEIFATPSIYERYKNNGRFIGSDKKRVLERASKFCKIRDDGDKQYYISKVYENPLPTNFPKMNADLYKYLCPLILEKLINDHDEKNRITMTVGVWARELKMVNDNYEVVREYPNTAMKQFYIKSSAFYDFYSKCDNAIDYYVVQALKYLYSAGLIIWREVYFYQPITPIIEKDGEQYKAVKKPKPIAATEDDMNIYSECLAIADKAAEITNASERYYSSKARIFKTVLTAELKEHGILYFYKTYEAYYVNKDRCKYVMDQFDTDDILTKFNNALTEKLLANAATRKEREREELLAEYLDGFTDMCDITINHKTESVKERLVCCSTHSK